MLDSLMSLASVSKTWRIRKTSLIVDCCFTIELWIEWIEDESNMATSEDEKKHVLDLYERATSDYLCR